MITIEKLKIEDIVEVSNLLRNLVPFKFSDNEAYKKYIKIINNPNYLIVVAKEDDKIIGTVSGIICECLATSFLAIEAFIVKDGLRGKGIGKKMMDFLEIFSKDNNCSYSILVSSSHRKEAHKFYEKMGFIDDVQGFRKFYFNS